VDEMESVCGTYAENIHVGYIRPLWEDLKERDMLDLGVDDRLLSK
jgi:hypothetical protein